jgi:hypothetical protein
VQERGSRNKAKKIEPSEVSLGCYLLKRGNIDVLSQPNIFSSYTDQAKRLLALNYGQFEALRHRTHGKGPLIQEYFSERAEGHWSRDL